MKKGTDFTRLSKIEKDFIKNVTFHKNSKGEKTHNKSISEVIIDDYGIGFKINWNGLQTSNFSVTTAPENLACFSFSMETGYDYFEEKTFVLYYQNNLAYKRTD